MPVENGCHDYYHSRFRSEKSGFGKSCFVAMLLIVISIVSLKETISYAKFQAYLSNDAVGSGYFVRIHKHHFTIGAVAFV
jgi:hypothetical protein